ncbi:MAG: hypothetical protein ACI934_001470 [Pseudohongiellaceae bacterium]|jgi:hypothetical protein
MKMTLNVKFLPFVLAFLLSACGGSDDAGTGTTQAPDMGAASGVVQEVVPCPSDPGITYICGLMNAEDLLSVGDTGMILTSGMSSEGVTGHLYLVNPLDDRWEELVFGANYSQDQDTGRYANCPGPMDVNNFSAHGLALNEYSANQFDLYITSHGAREAIEIFDLDMSEGIAELTWKGCVPLEESIMHNSVAILSDGGFVTTEFAGPEGFTPIFAGEENGGVKEWHPGGEVSVIEGTRLSGPNGIVVSEDDRYMFVAAFGTREIVRFDRSQDPAVKTTISLDIVLDNIRWGEPGKLLTAGGNAEGGGWSVVEMDIDTLEVVRVGGMAGDAAMQGVSSALQVNNEIWVGTYQGDRIGYFTKQ